MKLVFFFVSVFLVLCERQAWITTTTTTKPATPKPFTTTKPTTTTKPATTTKPTTTTTTTTTRRTTTTTTYYPTAGPGGNLKGKMFTLSQGAGVTFFPPNYSQDPSTTTTSTTTKPTTTTTKRTTTTTTTPKPTTTTTKRTTTTAKLKPTTTTTKPKPTTTKPNTTKRPTTTTQRTTTTTQRTTTTTKSTTTTWHPTTTAPVTRGVSVCLRFLADSSSINLFTLAPGSADAMSLSLSNQWYTLSLNRYYSSRVSLNPTIPLWSSVRTQPWTSVCVVLDSLKNVVQVFQGGSMSIRKIPVYRMVWSGEPVLTVSGFDGQVTDLEVWDFPLENAEIYRFMQNYGSSGTVLTWSNIAYTPNGNVLMEDTYSFGQGQPISSGEGEEQPIRSGQGRDQRRRHKKKFNERRQRKRQML